MATIGKPIITVWGDSGAREPISNNILDHRPVGLIDAFEKKTGVGVILNTSFNIQEPIVENPKQAIDCFLRSSVEWLAIGSYLCDVKWRRKVEENSL